MAVSYAYEHSLDDGYVKYNVSIPHGRTVFAGDAIAVSGVVKNTNNAFTSVTIYLVTSMYTPDGGGVGAPMLPNRPRFVVSGLSGDKNKEVEFSATIVMPTISRGDSYEYYSGANKVTGTVANGIPVGLWFYAGDWSRTGELETWQYAVERCSPAITVFEIQRGTNGIADDEGENALLSLKLSLANIARESSMTLKLYYAENSEATIDSSNIDLTTHINTMLSGVTEDSTLISETFSNSSTWNFLLVFGDEYESATVHYSLGRAFANVHLSGASTGGVCFGGFSSSAEGDPRFESRYPAYLYGGISQIGGAKASLRAMGMQFGSVAAQSCANGATLFVVTFDAPFESEPVVFVTPKTDASAASLGYISCMVVSGSVTTSGFSCRVFNNSSTARDIGLDWMAVGVPQYDADAPIVLQRPVAAMTSNNSGGCIVTASTVYSSSYPVWKAFDYKLSTSWACSTSDTAPWIQIQVDVAMKNIAVKIFARNSDYIQNPLAGNIQGSNDGSVWETIGSFSGWDSTATGKLLGTVECNNATAYQYVRINITSHGGSQNYVAIGYITVNGEK